METRIFFIAVAVILILYIYRNVRKNQISQDESILWMIGAIIILIFGIWPELIIKLADVVGIDYAPSLLFLLGCVFLFVFCFRNSQMLSDLKEKNKELIQDAALLDKRIRDLEKEMKQMRKEKDD
ncbi:MAG: DUF2304 domain-containing protein [Eubacteriaceae bacterium]|nr:DUF2304 domain-containing protein [Eubacteriaceae bacterium]